MAMLDSESYCLIVVAACAADCPPPKMIYLIVKIISQKKFLFKFCQLNLEIYQIHDHQFQQ